MLSETRVLIVEDLPADAELAEYELQKALGNCVFERVETQDGFLLALTQFQPNLIVSDFRLPQFDGLTALKLALDFSPTIPFIMLTGAINEDTAVESMKAGAWDYVIKEHIKRLGAAAVSALTQKQVRSDRQQAEVSLRQSEAQLKVAQHLGQIGQWAFDPQTQKVYWSDTVFAIYGRNPTLGPPSEEEEAAYYAPEVARKLHELAKHALVTGEPFEHSTCIQRTDGGHVDIVTVGTTLIDEQGQVTRLLGTVQDVTARKQAEAHLVHLNSTLNAFREINKLIIRERDPNTLVQQACRMLVAHLGYTGAWIAIPGSSVRTPTWAQAGKFEGLVTFSPPFDEQGNPGCLLLSQLRSGKVTVIEPKFHCGTCPLAKRYGEDELLVTELSHDGLKLGVLGVSHPTNRDVTYDEKALLGEFAADLAFALHNIELEQQRDHYAQIVSSSQEPMALIAPDFTYLAANPAYCRLVGTLQASLVGRTLVSVLGSTQFQEAVQSQLERCFAGQEVQFETVISSPTGKARQIEAVYSPCGAPNTRPSAVAVCIRDVTERKRAEVALQREKDNLNAFLSAAPIAIFVLDQAQRLVHANPAAEQLLELPLANALGARCGDLLRCSHRLEGSRGCGSGFACKSCALFAVIDETLINHTFAHEREIAIDNGPAAENRWFVVNAGPLTLSTGPGAVLALHDVTDRRRAEEKLRFQAMLLESQNEASIDGILVEDDRGKLLWHNRRFSTLWALSPDQLQPGSHGMPLLPLLEMVANIDTYQSCVAEMSLHRHTKCREELRLKDGRIFELFGAPIFDGTEKFLGRVWLFRDITEEKKLKASVAQSDRLASMGMLAAGVAHEINNPLSYVLYNLESLADDLKQQATQSALLHRTLIDHLGETTLTALLGHTPDFFDPQVLTDMAARFRDALSGTRRIKDIARGLGAFSRVDKHRVAQIDIRGPIESALSIASNEIKYRARIEQSYDTTALVSVSEGQLSQVFLNLLINAAHAITEGNVDGNKISLKTWDRDQEVFASVEDSGCGIPPENLERLFDPFFTTKPVGVGSGLGLNIAQNIIKSYGGTISVASKVGKGTLFVIRLPMTKAKPSPSVSPPSADQESINPTGRILVVDDDAAVRSILNRMLSGHDVVTAESGEAALEVLAQDQNFDVILCDIMMPTLSGIDVHRWLGEHHPHLASRIVFVTGGAFTAYAQAYLEQVKNLSLEKPFEASTLKQLVTERVLAARAEAQPEAQPEVQPQ